VKAECAVWRPDDGWRAGETALTDAHLVLFFGTRSTIGHQDWFSSTRGRYPDAAIVGCSTGGQILDGDVTDDVGTSLALKFDRTTVQLARATIDPEVDSYSVGAQLGNSLSKTDLAAVIVLSDGLHVNGSRLVSGLSAVLGSEPKVIGGLAGDGAEFRETLVAGDGPAAPRQVVAVGMAGSQLRIGVGCSGGWSEFGPRRVITRAAANTLYELDGKPALELYKRYLGEEAEGLPSTGLLFPLLIRHPDDPACALVRTILAVDPAKGSMTFAGDMPEGWTAQLMRGHIDRLVDAAGTAARQARESMGEVSGDSAALIISCIGRRLLMGQNVIEEIAEIQSAASSARIAGFYSYGEISPGSSGRCELHNQTMTVTKFGEVS
jgi:hypothetical protein